MRRIDADALKQLCDDMIQETWNSKTAPVSWANAYADFKDAIDSMPTITPSGWVSVEERLPGMSGNYICAVKDKNGSVWTIPAEWSLEMKMWSGAFGEIKNIVTHWMPLPAPPTRASILEEAMYCPACGKRLCSRFNNYCPNCGVKMDGGTP